MQGNNFEGSEIKGYIFDYGGTLDTAGRHWGRVLWAAYRREAVPVTEEQFREAYIHAERVLGGNAMIQPDYTFHKTLDIKLRIEMEYLMASGWWNANEKEYRETHDRMLAALYEDVKRQTAYSRSVLTELRRQCRMVLASNFYCNLGVVIEEFGLAQLFSHVIESAAVGIRKPDPRIFRLSVEALGVKPAETVAVGDSFYKDIEPARKAGCHTVWLKGEGWTDKQYDESVPDLIITDLRQLLKAAEQ